jgi:transcriptional regulator with XRE-family HTH domain
VTNPNRDRIAETFKQLLSKRNINAYRIAKETGIDKTYLSKLFSGAIANPGKDKLIKIARVLDIELEQLQKVFDEPEMVIQECGLEIQLNSPQVITPRQDWGSAPDNIICYERSSEFEYIFWRTLSDVINVR